MNFTRAEKIYLKAEFYNWDYGLDFLKNLLLDKDCDKATALLIYWRSDPGFYYQYNFENEIPEWSTEGYQLMKAVEELLLKNNFPERISYEPDLDRIPKDINILNKIPKKLLLPTVGNSDSTTLANQFGYGKLLIEACEKGDLEKSKEIINKRPDCIDICIEGNTPIHSAINKIKVFEHLIAKGANINNSGDENSEMQPIHSAVLIGKNRVVSILLQHGVNINTPTANTKRTPLHIILGISSEYFWNKYKLMSTLTFLLKKGADINIKNNDGKTALDLAIASKNELARSILEKHLT